MRSGAKKNRPAEGKPQRRTTDTARPDTTVLPQGFCNKADVVRQ